MPCVVDILEFVVSYINSGAEGVHTDLNEFGLELMNVALNAGGPGACSLSDLIQNSDLKIASKSSGAAVCTF